MIVTQDEVLQEIRRIQREAKRAWRAKNPEHVRELERASLERRALRNIQLRKAEEEKDGTGS